MRILLIEDEPSHEEQLLHVLRKRFPSVAVDVCDTESEFYAREKEVAADPPDLIVLDVMLRWSNPDPDQPPRPPEIISGGFFRAGFRIQKRLAMHASTRSVPVILFTALDREDLLQQGIERLPEHVFHVQKEDIQSFLIKAESLLAVSGPVAGRDAKEKKIFISYSHKDSHWLDDLLTTLRPYERDGRLILWDDRKLTKGGEWRAELAAHLISATASILLVSRDFLASDFIAQNELPPLLKAAREKGLTILWIAVSASPVKQSPLYGYQSLNDPDRPLDSLPKAKRAKEWVRIAEGIDAALNGDSSQAGGT